MRSAARSFRGLWSGMDDGSSSGSGGGSVVYILSSSSSAPFSGAVSMDTSSLSAGAGSAGLSGSQSAPPSTPAPSFLDYAEDSLDAGAGAFASPGSDNQELSASTSCPYDSAPVNCGDAAKQNGAVNNGAAASPDIAGAVYGDDALFVDMNDGWDDAPAASEDEEAQRPAAQVPSNRRLVFRQKRPGPRHGLGGRKKGSGRETKKNFGRGLRRVVGAFLSETTSEVLSAECGVSTATAQGTIDLLKRWAGANGSEEIWMVPGVFGVVARWREWGRGTAGKNASVCVWLDPCGRSRCTCVEADVYQDNSMHERPTACHHAGVFDAVLDEIARVLAREGPD